MKKRIAAFLTSALCLLPSAFASELTVDKRTLQPDDELTITVTLDGTWASADPPRIPLRNLVIDDGPSISTEFQWINGQTSRRKVMRYSAHPQGSGAAVIGPVTLRDRYGAVLVLPAVTLTVSASPVPASNDPAQIMREMMATDRDPIFIIAQADKTQAFEGEEIVVTWTLYSGETIQQFSLGEMPKLDDFWSEELDVRNEEPEQIVLGGIPAQKLTLRRAALFPLRSGTLTIGSMAVHAAVMKRASSGDPFGLFEGVMADVHRRSAAITITAKAIPSGRSIAGVADDVNMQCTAPAQKNGGPVVFDVALSGSTNLRSVQPPAWQTSLDGTAQIVDRGIAKTERASEALSMTRRWRYLVFPARSGPFRLPALSTTYLTLAGVRREARCEARTLNVMTAVVEPPAPMPMRRLRATPHAATMITAAAVLIALLFTIPRTRKKIRLRRDVQQLVRDTPSATRAAVEEQLVARGIDPIALMREASDRGDAFRALRSLIDAAERDRIAATRRDIAHRIRDLLVALQSTHADHAAAPPPAVHDR